MRVPNVIFCFLALSAPAMGAPVEEHISKMSLLSEAECRSEEERFRRLYSGADQKVEGTISFIAEGTRLVCESIRLSEEQKRLRVEQERLRLEAARLEGMWQSAHATNPVEFPDIPGRDASQVQLLEDAEAIGGTINVLGGVRNNLEEEARRILTLAADEFNLLSGEQSALVLASLDGEDEYDVIIRLLTLS